MPLLWSWVPDIIGCVGTLIILVAYALLQARRLEADGILYSLLNVLGAAMILVSLYHVWNMAAVVMEVTWLIISAYGLGKGLLSCLPSQKDEDARKSESCKKV